MRKDCIKAVSQAIGRDITNAEAINIEERIGSANRRLSQQDRQAYLGMTENQRLTEAGKIAAEELRIEMAKKQQRVALTILQNERFVEYYQNQPGQILDNIDRTLAARGDDKDNIQSVDTRGDAIYHNFTQLVSDEIVKFGPKKLGFLDNDKAMVPIFKELRGHDTGIPEAKAFAKNISEIMETMRKRYNDAGGKIGKLEDYGNPQSHSHYKVWSKGKDDWVRFIEPLLDKSKYVKDDGNLMTQVERVEFLGKAWESIAYDGILKERNTQLGGMRANRHSASRQLHFKDAESYLSYHKKFSDKSLMATMINNIHRMSNDIALIESYGPNPDNQFQHWLKQGEQEAARANVPLGEITKKSLMAQKLYDEIAGYRPPILNESVAKGGETVRNILNMRLGSAVITAVSDNATAILTSKINNIAWPKYFSESFKVLPSPARRRHAKRMGLGLDTMLFAANRYVDENLSNGFSAKLSGFVIRSSGLGFMTDASKQAFGAILMDSITHLAKNHKKITSLHPDDNRILLSKGVTDTDWSIWRLAKPEAYGRYELLNSNAIMAIDEATLKKNGFSQQDQWNAATKHMGIILEESNKAITTPDARDRYNTTGQIQRGSLEGEIRASLFQFKSFPIAMFTKNIRRYMNMPTTTSRYGYGAGFIVLTTMFGAMAVQLAELSSGRDPIDMNDKRFWMKALMKGGGLGLYGDFLYSTSTQYGQGGPGALLGPAIGQAFEGVSLTAGNIIRSGQGDKTHAGAEFARFVKGITPGSSVWYLKAAMDHMIFQEWMEAVNPGYLRRMEKRAKREFKQKYWWRPKGRNLPKRAPDLSRALGK